MPTKASVPVEAFPCIDRSRGHGPLLQGPWAPPTQTVASVAAGGCATNCRSGPWPRKRPMLSKRFRPIHSISGNHAESQNGYVPNVRANPARIGFRMMYSATEASASSLRNA